MISRSRSGSETASPLGSRRGSPDQTAQAVQTRVVQAQNKQAEDVRAEGVQSQSAQAHSARTRSEPPGVIAQAPSPQEPRSPPVLIVRTYSVRRGRKSEYRVQSLTSAENLLPPMVGRRRSDSSGSVVAVGAQGVEPEQRRVEDRKALRLHVARLMGRHPEVHIDLSYNWIVLDQASGARTALATGLLAGGSSKKLCIDVSNRRQMGLSEGAAVRYQQGMNPKAWQKAVIDTEAPALADALGKELTRVAREQVDMPVFSLVCHDQPLATVVNPLLKPLARHAQALVGLDRLDLNRYSRSAEVSEARPPAQDPGGEIERFVIRLGVLLATSRSLRELCVRMNGLTAPDLMTLMYSKNATLERLDLSCNPLCLRAGGGRRTLKGIMALARYLAGNPRLIELDLSFCGINIEAANLLLKALDRNRHLQKIDLTGNPIPSSHPIFRDARALPAAQRL